MPITFPLQVLVQLFFTSVRVHRPLSVLCCTWNVGNEAPPEDLSPWLKGVDKQEHDIVAIGQSASRLLVGSERASSQRARASKVCLRARILRQRQHLQHAAAVAWLQARSPASAVLPRALSPRAQACKSARSACGT